MSPIFKKALYSIVGLLLVSGLLYRFYLNAAPYVPAWVPPPICPCWDTNTFSCQPRAFCHGYPNLYPTPTPYLSPHISTQPKNSVTNLTLTPDCQVRITFSHQDPVTLPLPSSTAVTNSICSSTSPSYLSPGGKYAAFENNINPHNPALSVYFLDFNKIITLESLNSGRLQHAIFLPDQHLVVLLHNQLKTYDLTSLSTTYPTNVDFYLNRFKTITLQSTTIPLEYSSQTYSSLHYDGNKIIIRSPLNVPLTEYDQTLLHPRSSCPCWDNQNNFCLPSSACQQTP